MTLPCPQCGSHRSLGSLRKKLLEVKVRIASVKRYESDHVHTHSPSGHTHSLTSPVGYQATIHSHAAIQVDDNAILGGRITNDKVEDTLFINDAWVEVCADCGTFYAPNVDEVGDALQQEIYKLDPLGALAEIRGEDE